VKSAFCSLLIFLLFTAWLPQRIYLSAFGFGIFVLVICWLPHMFRRNIPMIVSPAILLVLAPPCFGILQLAAGLAAYPWRTAVSTLDWFALAATAWLAAQFAANSAFARTFLRVLVWTGLIISVLGALHWYASPGLILWTWTNPYQLRATFPLLNHSHFAALVELALAPAVWTAMKADKLEPFHTWAAAAMVCAVWLAGSRSGAAIVTFELAAVILLSVRSTAARAFPRARVLVLIVPALVLVAGIGWQGMAARNSLPQRDDLRVIFARAALGMVKDRPLSGFGLGSFATVYPAYAPVDVGLYVEHAHNDWLEWAAEGGVLFPVLFLGLAVLALSRSLASPWCFGIFAVFVQAAAEFPLHNPVVAAWQFAALGCMLGCAFRRD